MFCWPCIIVCQYRETNVMHFLFNLLRIKGLYMFRALLAHPQDSQHKRYLVYCVSVMSVGCTRFKVPLDMTMSVGCTIHLMWLRSVSCTRVKVSSTLTLVQPTDITRTQYTKCSLCSASRGWESNARNMQRPLILNKLSKKCITLVSLCWCHPLTSLV
jgi:hypothetical protein